jgi:hypothetical protein
MARMSASRARDAHWLNRAVAVLEPPWSNIRQGARPSLARYERDGETGDRRCAAAAEIHTLAGIRE